MMADMSDKIVRSLRAMYKEPSAKAMFDWAASRERDAAQTTIAVISERAGLNEPDARALAYKLEELGCCKFILGRKGHATRVKWKYSLIGLGRAAQGADGKLDVIEYKDDFEESELEERALTIPEAKRLLAKTLGIEPDAIEITVKA
jgi:hypothetical protein